MQALHGRVSKCIARGLVKEVKLLDERVDEVRQPWENEPGRANLGLRHQ